MKENVLGIIMAALILVSAMGAAFNVRPTLAGVDPSTVGLKEKAAPSSSERPNAPNEKDSNTDWRGILNGSSGLSQKSSSSDLSGKNMLNLSEPNEWSESAYREGDKTRLIVGISTKGLASFSQLERIVNKHQAQIVNAVTIHGTPMAVVVELRLTAVTAFTEDIRTFGLASYVEPNMRVQTLLTPNDQYWSRQWGPQKIGANWAWDTTKGSHDVIVAVVDTGIDYTHS